MPPWAEALLTRQSATEHALSSLQRTTADRLSTLEDMARRLQRDVLATRQMLSGRMQAARLGFLSRSPTALLACTFNAWHFASDVLREEKRMQQALADDAEAAAVEAAQTNAYGGPSSFRLAMRAGVGAVTRVERSLHDATMARRKERQRVGKKLTYLVSSRSSSGVGVADSSDEESDVGGERSPWMEEVRPARAHAFSLGPARLPDTARVHVRSTDLFFSLSLLRV